MQATPTTDTVSPVPVADLADYLGVEATDPLLPGMLVAATDAVINYLQRDLLQREWVGIIKASEPITPQLSPYNRPSTTFDLPFAAPLVSVDQVETVDGDPVTYTLRSARRPAQITLLDWDYLTDVEVQYTVGSATVPSAIESAIMLVAGFLYEHRGECDADGAMKRSGAANLLMPYRVEMAL